MKNIGAFPTTRASFGQGTGEILLSNVQCIGSEERLVDCRRINLNENACSHSEDAGVTCQERTSQFITLRK